MLRSNCWSCFRYVRGLDMSMWMSGLKKHEQARDRLCLNDNGQHRHRRCANWPVIWNIGSTTAKQSLIQWSSSSTSSSSFSLALSSSCLFPFPLPCSRWAVNKGRVRVCVYHTCVRCAFLIVCLLWFVLPCMSVCLCANVSYEFVGRWVQSPCLLSLCPLEQVAPCTRPNTTPNLRDYTS